MAQTNSLFSFGVITDTHIRAPGGDLSTVFPVNTKANNRARYAVDLLKKEEHDFVIHLGDVVHPLQNMNSYFPAVKEAHQILAPLKPRLNFVPGNHDLGDKLSEVAPAKAANDTTVSVYREAFGKNYYSFEHNGILFVVMNSSLVNGGTEEEKKQRSWLEDLLAEERGKRKFLFSHYPPFICQEFESEHYDNYAEPGRHWLLELAVFGNVEAIISGHVHHFFLNEHKGVKLYCLPATSFTRQDFSAIFRGLPSNEFGRDDTGKFGVTVFNIKEQGHDFTWIPTYGKETIDDKNNQDAKVKPLFQIPNLIPSLRHDWCQSTAMPANGPMEEFTRKVTRNDYPILRLKQLGIKKVRVPLVDFLDPVSVARIRVIDGFGIRAVVFFSGNISKKDFNTLMNMGESIYAIEVIGLDIPVNILKMLRDTALPVWYSKISTSAKKSDDTKPFNISVSTGCMADEMKEVSSNFSAISSENDLRLVVQCPWEGNDTVFSVQKILKEWGYIENKGVKLAINVRLAPSNPAEENADSIAMAQTIKGVQSIAENNPEVEFILDTFEAFDRGYHPRLGLVDTRSNISDWYPHQ
jgi:predicted phosphodiesterase